MSNIYIQEPPSNGKVLLKTTAGEIDIELWSKEAPKACRNFVQLCLEGYYDNTIFHRVVPEFIIQGGDPTGTGTGGESVFGKPFRDEFHSRLRFNRRGLVAMANAGPHDNGSQFFFTLGRADELNNKHTIFGKVTGDTIYNILRLAEVDIGEDERPVNPHKIKCTEVLFNPFDDIIPRIDKKTKKDEEEEGKKSKAKGTKNFNLLSFGEEAEEDEEEVNEVSKVMRGKSKSSHDLLKDDPRLSSVPAVEREKDSQSADSDKDEDEMSDDDDEEEDDEMDSDEKHQMKDRISNKLRKDPSKSIKQAENSDEAEERKSSRSEELRREARQLKRELKAAKEKKENNIKESETAKEAENTVANSALEEYLKEKEKYEEVRKKNTNKGVSREQQTLALLDRFKSKLTQAITEPPKEEEASDVDEENDKGWLSHVLQFEEKSGKVKDANMQDEDTFEIYDPRNPVNKRRREESKKIMKQKKERR
ncbi:spliceosome-associated protein CWC27 homolog [Xenopus laevis]|uniref:Spliceosome-associated protein CWC27 homolog n=1 Tax=Xenopus laevis TaxID=8355 RepID=CWC27_XENLA|nr:spliceosome-associated protein CWC27 homolog [Xenopus laevis]Q6GLX7.1 RecName: Full=Spliceosome-associated protein CWC27 homolog; AltName: Full=Probable inactive peptidyl-prolyl cis-trans isomerase CWC27 homolog; Short=PPIase CWC27 [Xenopus laevis]AAH74317.1 MGC84139 protein [Xenopus laevis]